jgi:hypothetical protein
MYLFLDDQRTPKDVTWIDLPTADWVIVRNYNDFCAAIERFFEVNGKMPEFISFDNDLCREHYEHYFASAQVEYLRPNDKNRKNFKEKMGLDCAEWVLGFCKKHSQPLPRYALHTMNHIARDQMQLLFMSFESKLMAKNK